MLLLGQPDRNGGGLIESRGEVGRDRGRNWANRGQIPGAQDTVVWI